jgi:glyoxylase-like metal-dependent hydrolase (beta-lactamase superfamily II)
VVTTHQHWDHHRALADVVGATSAATVAGVPDAAAITEQTGVPIALEVVQGDTVPVGDCTLQVIALAGHTPGSIALLYDDSASEGGHPHLFTGDSLFPGGVGNTFGDSDAFAQLLDEVSTKIFDQLPDDTWFYPGHGNDSTLGAERPHLGEWRARGW